MFRYPKDKINKRYYDDSDYYYEPKISILPTNAELTQLKPQNFKKSIYDISDKIELIKEYIKEGNVLDYGANWGYNLWQFIKEGFSGLGYEIAVKRAEFGQENLGLKIIYDSQELDSLGSVFDVIFINHVLEHIEDIRNEFNRIYRLLKDGGYIFIFVPDCSDIVSHKWKKIYAFGKKHCLAFDNKFFYKNFPTLGFSIVEIKEHFFDANELTVIAKKK